MIKANYKYNRIMIAMITAHLNNDKTCVLEILNCAVLLIPILQMRVIRKEHCTKNVVFKMIRLAFMANFTASSYIV